MSRCQGPLQERRSHRHPEDPKNQESPRPRAGRCQLTWTPCASSCTAVSTTNPRGHAVTSSEKRLSLSVERYPKQKRNHQNLERVPEPG